MIPSKPLELNEHPIKCTRRVLLCLSCARHQETLGTEFVKSIWKLCKICTIIWVAMIMHNWKKKYSRASCLKTTNGFNLRCKQLLRFSCRNQVDNLTLIIGQSIINCSSEFSVTHRLIFFKYSGMHWRWCLIKIIYASLFPFYLVSNFVVSIGCLRCSCSYIIVRVEAWGGLFVLEEAALESMASLFLVRRTGEGLTSCCSRQPIQPPPSYSMCKLAIDSPYFA